MGPVAETAGPNRTVTRAIDAPNIVVEPRARGPKGGRGCASLGAPVATVAGATRPASVTRVPVARHPVLARVHGLTAQMAPVATRVARVTGQVPSAISPSAAAGAEGVVPARHQRKR